MEHTPKNLLIRAVRRKSASGATKAAASKALTDVLKLRSQLDVQPLSLERKLNELGQLSLAEMSSVDSSTSGISELTEVAERPDVHGEIDKDAAS